MRCAICKHGETTPGRSTLTLERGTTVVVTREVPALVCDICGEAFFTGEVLNQLLLEAEAAVARGVEIEVRHYTAP